MALKFDYSLRLPGYEYLPSLIVIPGDPSPKGGHAFPVARHPSSNVGHALSVAGHPSFNVGHAIPVAGHPSSKVGHAFPVAGHPSSDIGHAFPLPGQTLCPRARSPPRIERADTHSSAGENAVQPRRPQTDE